MSDHYQTAVDLDADIQSAEVTVAHLRDWMIAREIIVAEKTDCTLGEPLGHAPGRNYGLATSQPSAVLFQTKPNGVAFISEHTVFYPAGEGVLTMVCASCGKRFELNDAWSAALDEWLKGSGPGIVTCPVCGAGPPITEWHHDPPWGFGNVGIKFWNWPPLREDFLKSLGESAGHRFRLVYGKI